MSSPFDAINFETPEGVKLLAGLTNRLRQLREENDSVELDQTHTAFKRGQIAEVKSLLQKPMAMMTIQSYYRRED